MLEQSLPRYMMFMVSRNACSDSVAPTLKLTKVQRVKLAHLKNKNYPPALLHRKIICGLGLAVEIGNLVSQSKLRNQ